MFVFFTSAFYPYAHFTVVYFEKKILKSEDTVLFKSCLREVRAQDNFFVSLDAVVLGLFVFCCFFFGVFF